MKNTKVALYILHCFVGIGALFGGVLGMTDPSGGLIGMPATEALKNSPFKNFLIPGIFLFVVIGLGNLLAFISMKYKLKYSGYFSGFMGITLCMWIIIQCYMLYAIHILHIIFLIIGIIQVVLATKLLYSNTPHILKGE